MKRLAGLIVLFAAAALADDYRTFTSSDGRTLKAKVIAYDSSTGKVQIEREDRKKLTVSSNAFSQKDQDYLQAWETAQVFMSPAKFKLEIEREEVKTTKKEHEVDVGEEFAGGGRRGGGESGVITVAIDKTTDYKYHLAMENKGGMPLKNIIMEYRIFYEQEKPVKDDKANKGRRENDPRPEYHVAVEQKKVKDGQSRLKPIEPKENRSVSTENVSLLKRSANRPWGDMIDLKSGLSGVWIKLTMKGPAGDKLIREIASPESVMNKFAWELPDTQAEEAPEEPTEDAKTD
jgi:hypothetical protein